MKLNSLIIYLSLAAVMAFMSQPEASAQTPAKQPDMYERAEQEADRLQQLLDLEDWQVFYVDSTLKANFFQLQVDLENLHKSKVSNTTLFQEARDKCWDEIDRNFKKWFTETQWAAYLKSGAGKAQKQRAKRQQQKVQ